jgi:DNA-binding MarR family transcriptional regulator
MNGIRARADVEVFGEIGRIDKLVTARLERSLPEGLSAAQFGVLAHFCRKGGAGTPARLARALQVTKGAMTNTVQRLEAQGFVDVAPDGADGRRKLVTLTPSGAAAYEQAVAALRPYNADLRDTFPEAEFTAALPFLRKLREWLDDAG